MEIRLNSVACGVSLLGLVLCTWIRHYAVLIWPHASPFPCQPNPVECWPNPVACQPDAACSDLAACWCNLVHRAMLSSPQSSLHVQKFGSRGVAINAARSSSRKPTLGELFSGPQLPGALFGSTQLMTPAGHPLGLLIGF